MGRKVTSMSVKLQAAIVAVSDPEQRKGMNVSELCRAEQISRKTFYKWVDRYQAGGLEALEERSRRPSTVPNQTPADVEDEIIRRRKELADAGLDHGATTIQWHLGRDDVWRDRVPSVATIHRVLVRRGLVVPAPGKRPKGSWRRFEAPAPNEWWQIDAMEWVIGTGVVRVFNIIDDHSRLLVRSLAVTEATTRLAWVAFSQGAQHWGLPAGVLSDNGMCFSGKLRRFEVYFEARLRDAGVRPFTGRPFHPQTTGKVERFQQTLKRWLRRQRLAADLAEFQAQLDAFAVIYNFERPHQGIGRQLPIERWRATPAAGPAAGPLEHPDYAAPIRTWQVRVDKAGQLKLRNAGSPLVIALGVEHEGRDAIAVVDDLHVNVFIDGELIRHLRIDPTRAYQPSGRKRGGPKRPRIA